MWRVKKKIVEKYLPMWCRLELMEENARLNDKIKEQAGEISRLNAYIDGVHHALHYRQKIVINGSGDSK